MVLFLWNKNEFQVISYLVVGKHESLWCYASVKKKKTKGGISDNFFKPVHSDIFNIQYIAQIDNLLKHFVLQYTAYSATELWQTVCDYCPASL